ncbi:YoaK family protein (plasmid) [Streptomyces sp. BI20]|uniref:YoaK family protein n=1 Tax=Streptomyces sp. BI20 TaxID=3403460 RepID=UPI003C76E888
MAHAAGDAVPGAGRSGSSGRWGGVGWARERDGPLPGLLLALTVVAGAVDAFGFLVLGHVFVANMTGNVVLLALSLTGGPGLSAAGSALALGAFFCGALVGGRVARRTGHRGRLVFRAGLAQAVLVGGAGLAVFFAGVPGPGAGRAALIVVLAFGVGLQNAAVRGLGVPDLTTTVLTMTITGIAADLRRAGGAGPAAWSGVRARVASTVCLFAGAAGGGLVIGAGAAAGALAGAVLVLAGVVWVAGRSRDGRAPWTRPSRPPSAGV